MVNSMTTGRIVQPNKGRAALKPKPFGNKILATLSDKKPDQFRCWMRTKKIWDFLVEEEVSYDKL